jgi:hypothetical protein
LTSKIPQSAISSLESQIKKKNDTLLEKSNAITALIKSNVIKENIIKELEAQIESKDAALKQKVKTITEVNLSNSTKDNKIKYLEAQAKEKDKSIAALKDELANYIINGGFPKQEVERLVVWPLVSFNVPEERKSSHIQPLPRSIKVKAMIFGPAHPKSRQKQHRLLGLSLRFTHNVPDSLDFAERLIRSSSATEFIAG